MKVVEARGTFRAVGQAVGEATREEIAFMRRVMVPELLQGSFRGDQLRMVRDGRKHFEHLKRFWPEASLYVRGLAAGANLKLDEILPIAFQEEMSAPLARERCSTLLVRTDDGWLVGHQEDYKSIFYGKLAVLDLEFAHYPRLVSLTYPGTFPGMAVSLNAAGIGMTCNALMLKPVPGLGKQSKHFLASVEETFQGAMTWICNGPHILTDHFLVIGGEEDLAASVEVTPRPEARVSVEIREIVPNADAKHESAFVAPFTHANHIRWLRPWASGHARDPAHAGSAMRQRELQRVAAANPPEDPDAMLAWLRREDGILHRNAHCNRTGQPNSVTIASAVLRPGTREAWFIGYGGDGEMPVHFKL